MLDKIHKGITFYEAQGTVNLRCSQASTEADYKNIVYNMT